MSFEEKNSEEGRQSQLPRTANPEPIASQGRQLTYLTGWRLHMTTFGLCIGLFLVNLEVTIVSTSSLAIANDLHSYDQLGWILTGYLITYTGFIMIWAKFSDYFGQKSSVIASSLIFVLFSGGCGAAQTITQLIVCRVFQGIGAAGGFALGILFFTGMVPKEKFPLYGAVLSSTVALANLAGPLLGGALSKNSQWRWVFLLNVPVSLFSIIILLFSIPTGFPYHNQTASSPTFTWPTVNTLVASYKKIDYLGAGMLLFGSLLLSAGLLESGKTWEWRSAPAICILVIAGVLFIAFFAWERLVSSDRWTQEPMFPWKFVHNRVWMGVLLSSLLNGLPFFVLVIFVPQRLETVHGESPVQAGIKILPYTLVAAVGAVIASLIVSTGRIAPIYIMLFFSALGAVGTGLLTTITSTEYIPNEFYGYLTLIGLGIGGTWGLTVPFVGHAVDQMDVSSACGALIQFRILGGALGIAIMSATMETYLRQQLPSTLSPVQLSAILKSTTAISLLPPELQAHVIEVFAQGYSLQLKIVTGFSVAQFLAITMIWRNPQIMFAERKKKENIGS
ncbi:MFS general substrate transporter [Periconia macrospinosa]|uniref:MFS general substrate transporter n=1 Tax=Periconia macrospinosa TaxID=97972 RepID=A0A2V1DN30_9PLEO|nr:MFS general substrate transporter [Periconia macrospinosa]